MNNITIYVYDSRFPRVRIKRVFQLISKTFIERRYLLLSLVISRDFKTINKFLNRLTFTK